MFHIILALLFATSLSATERITNFHSDITVHENGSMTVREDITVKAEGRRIRRGIVREFPTTYKDKRGNWYNVGFDIKTTLMDGKPVAYFVETARNGKKLNFGDDSFIRHGLHTFTVEYTTNRQLGFFEDHDELYWNVTGLGWRLPIEHVTARVHLPSAIPTDKIRFDAYTGAYGSRAQDVEMHRIAHGVAFETTRPFREYEGLTIVVGWPKGYISEPTLVQKWRWFFDDNKHILLFILGLCVLLMYLILISIRIRKKRLQDPIIPLFYPPEGMLPGGMRYFIKMGYDSVVLAADVVNMAVQGWLTMDYTVGWWGSGTYTLKKKTFQEDREPLYKSLFSRFFVKDNEITLGSANNKAVQNAIEDSESYYKKKYTNLFDYHGSETFWAIFIAVLFGLGVTVLMPDSIWLFLSVFAYGFCIYFFYRFMKGYTKEGMLLQNKIEGFKLFLATTEIDRLKVIGTPPTKTPELYETYLPYAMALGVEEAWSAQFAPLFEKLEVAGNPYMPIWIVGWNGRAFHASRFSSQMSKGMSSAISSSASVPGSTSGFRGGGGGGGGFSGGGGGGGGGGGR